jgi:hypothetical protein
MPAIYTDFNRVVIGGKIREKETKPTFFSEHKDMILCWDIMQAVTLLRNRVPLHTNLKVFNWLSGHTFVPVNESAVFSRVILNSMSCADTAFGYFWYRPVLWSVYVYNFRFNFTTDFLEVLIYWTCVSSERKAHHAEIMIFIPRVQSGLGSHRASYL